MSTKTVAIDDSVHLLLSKKQIELREKGIDKKFSEITNDAIRIGINKVGTINTTTEPKSVSNNEEF